MIYASMNLWSEIIDSSYDWLHRIVGNADAHAKNFSRLYSNDASRASLAPVYVLNLTKPYEHVLSVYPAFSKWF